MTLSAIPIAPDIYWVGAIDWAVRNFHGYTTHRGTTYNAYLIIDKKITLVDTVKKGFEHELLERIASVIDPSKIDYIISDHSEPDHSGTLREVVAAVKPEKVFASVVGQKTLARHFGDIGIPVTAVKDGYKLSLGKRTIAFMETRMLHWPDSMFSYLVEDQLLFSQDAFGMHLATAERFDDELSWDLLERMSSDYYANIITLYSPQVAKLLEKVAASGLSFKMVAPDHGPIWRDMARFGKMVENYGKWSARELVRKAVILYDTMWHATEEMARYIADGIVAGGVKAEVMPLGSSSRSDVASMMIDAAALVVGSPTLNNNVYPSLADALTYLRGLKFGTPVGAVFGSYGWSGEGTAQLKEYLASMNCAVIGEVKTQYVPDAGTLTACRDLGMQVAAKVKELLPE
ncbi:MAG TPA: FprA family A-type flavoprotein [bacterium]|nr:FprA family A-type flavoprotein [bacterium]